MIEVNKLKTAKNLHKTGPAKRVTTSPMIKTETLAKDVPMLPNNTKVDIGISAANR